MLIRRVEKIVEVDESNYIPEVMTVGRYHAAGITVTCSEYCKPSDADSLHT